MEIQGCSALGLSNKKTKKTKEVSPWLAGLRSLPYDIVLNCVAQVSRLDLAAFAMASKSLRSLVVSPELRDLRWRMGCMEPSLYLCLSIFPDPDLSSGWFILNPVQRRLKPIPSNQMPELSSSFVVVNWGIYVIGGLLNGNPSSEVWLLDCFEHTWWPIPSMKMARASASASLIDGKIYVFGGLGDDVVNSDNWAEVFDPKTRTWEILSVLTQKMPLNIRQSVVIKEKEVYAVDKDCQIFSYSPSKGSFLTTGQTDSKAGYRNNLCVIGELLYCRGDRGEVLWCKPDELNWEVVKGLEELLEYDFCKLCTNSAGNIVIFWVEEDVEILELMYAEISLERRQGGREIWGNIEWSGAVFTLDLESHSNIRVLCSASVFA